MRCRQRLLPFLKRLRGFRQLRGTTIPYWEQHIHPMPPRKSDRPEAVPNRLMTSRARKGHGIIAVSMVDIRMPRRWDQVVSGVALCIAGFANENDILEP